MNPIATENARIDGVTPRAAWDIPADSSVTGFAFPLSVNRGGSIALRIRSTQPFTVSIFRIGWYGGDGARQVATLYAPDGSEQFPPADQPRALQRDHHESVSCANWHDTATYTHDPALPSGLYMARAMTPDGVGQLIPFVIRDDSRESDILVQFSDTTWHAYNLWTDNPDDPTMPPDASPRTVIGIFYAPDPYGGVTTRASYHRPFTGSARYDSPEHGYRPMYHNTITVIRWLERIGANVSYITGQAVAQDYRKTLHAPERSLLLPDTPGRPRLFMTVGHDEYYSQEQRNNVERAKAAGVHLAFLAGNHMYWRTRWDDWDADDLPHTLICEKHSNKVPRAGIPQDEWTGMWNDGRYVPSADPADSTGPENSTTGTVSAAYTMRFGDILVTYSDGGHRFWRNTPYAQHGTMGGGTLNLNMHDHAHYTIGHEWNHADDNGCQPPGLIRLSSTPMHGVNLNFGIGDRVRGYVTSTHSLTLFRDQHSGALVFHANTILLGQALDTFRIAPWQDKEDVAMRAMQQAMVNLFADMGMRQPDTLGELSWTPPDGEHKPPEVSVLTINDSLERDAPINQPVLIRASPSRRVEISMLDDQWHAMLYTGIPEYEWTPPYAGQFSLRARATDALGYVSEPSEPFTVTITPVPGFCQHKDDYPRLWDAIDPTTFIYVDTTFEMEAGTHFTAETDGLVEGVRFYRHAQNRGPHYVSLWQMIRGHSTWIASAHVPAYSDDQSGWVEARFTAPIRTYADGIYIASYHSQTGITIIETASGDTPDSLPNVGSSPRFLRAGYAQIQRHPDTGFILPKKSAESGAPVEQRPYIFYPVEPLFRPTASPHVSLWQPHHTMPMNVLAKAETRMLYGLEFESDVPGFVVGARFCHPTKSRQQPVVMLWSSDELLAIASRIGGVMGATYWRDTTFPQPIPIEAGRTYTIAYASPEGWHAVTEHYFRDGSTPIEVTTYPLRAKRGVFGAYNPDSPQMPTQSENFANYWVDVVFRTRP